MTNFPNLDLISKKLIFRSVKPVAAEAKKEEAEKDNDEDDEDAPPKVEIKPVQEDDAFYSIR